MQPLGQIDPLQPGRPLATGAQRRTTQQQQQQADQATGYAWLLELCRLGESDRARHLAATHPEWGYEIIDGTVQERLDPESAG